jgi:hypothetical protein
LRSHEIQLRKWKKSSTIKETLWNFEIGEPQKNAESLLATTSKNVRFAIYAK